MARRIFITGDTHRAHDIKKLTNDYFTIGQTLDKEDFVIICGDFGFIWEKQDLTDGRPLKWLDEQPWTTLFVDGNHENHDLLDSLPTEQWCGGAVHRINDSVLHLMRGEVFEIAGYTFFTFGGADSIDKGARIEGISWWRRELPNKEEYQRAEENLKAHGMKVDYVLTHTASTPILEQFFDCRIRESDYLCDWFKELEEQLDFKHWYFGHLHADRKMDDRHTLLYQRIIEIDGEEYEF
ncbi:MAG: metallophosphoesterase, partial [Coriobacteriales bacterium]|nr:metallophosphoesterase [Coriobacteriales bacterium]